MSADLRQMRYFMAVAEHGNFTRAADELHVAQQAVSQQIRALEATLGVTLRRRTSRKVELTPAGDVFLADAKQVLAASDRATRRVQAAARGEAGTLRLVYTLVTAFETTPALLELLSRRHPELKVSAREVYGADVTDRLLSGECDVALMPMGSLPRGLRQRLIRREVLRLAVSDRHPLAGTDQVELSALKHELFDVFPRQASPGYYDVVVGACRVAGFEPSLEEHHAGSTVWCHDIATRSRHRANRQLGSGAACARRRVRQPGPTAADAGHQRGLVRRRRAADDHMLLRRRVAGGRAWLAINGSVPYATSRYGQFECPVGRDLARLSE